MLFGSFPSYIQSGIKHQRQAAFLCLISMALQALMVSRINAVPKNYILRFLNNLQAHLSSKLIKSHPITEVEPHPKEHSLTQATYWPHPSSDGVLLSDTQRSVLSCLRGISETWWLHWSLDISAHKCTVDSQGRRWASPSWSSAQLSSGETCCCNLSLSLSLWQETKGLVNAETCLSLWCEAQPFKPLRFTHVTHTQRSRPALTHKPSTLICTRVHNTLMKTHNLSVFCL